MERGQHKVGAVLPPGLQESFLIILIFVGIIILWVTSEYYPIIFLLILYLILLYVYEKEVGKRSTQ